MVDFTWVIPPYDIGTRMAAGTQQDWDDFAKGIDSWDGVERMLIALSKEAEKDLTGWRAVIAEERDKMQGLIDAIKMEAE